MLNPKRIFVLTAFILLLAARLDAARPLPESVYDSLNSRSIFIFSDQLGSISEGEAEFAATHYVGCQKIPRASIDRIRKYNENFIHMHYKLGVTVDSMATYWMILKGDWVQDNYQEGTNWFTVRQHDDWPLKNSAGEMVVHGNPYRRVVMDLARPVFWTWSN